jgi:hypothetical protein
VSKRDGRQRRERGTSCVCADGQCPQTQHCRLCASMRTRRFTSKVTLKRTLQCFQVTDDLAAIVRPSSVVHVTTLISKQFWGEAPLIANYLQNQSSIKGVKCQTPYEVWIRRIPNLSYLNFFGSLAFGLSQKDHSKKIDNHTISCIFLGYYEEQKAYRLISKDNRKIIIFRDVNLDKNLSSVASTQVPWLIKTSKKILFLPCLFISHLLSS